MEIALAEDRSSDIELGKVGRGRPSGYSIELATVICDRIRAGESLIDVCVGYPATEERGAIPGVASKSMVMRWLKEWTEFRDLYTGARLDQADTMADMALRVAQRSTFVTVMADRLLVDTIKWRAGKLKPQVYGDKVQHTGPEGGPLQLLITSVERAGLGAPDELPAIEGEVVPKAGQT